MRFLILAAVLTAGFLPLEAAPKAPAAKSTVVYVVRHAEKAKIEGERNPPLTDRGAARAEDLARTLGSTGLRAVYSTKYKRTTDTATPSAVATGLEVTPYGARDSRSLGERLRREGGGGAILVVGHSNTVPLVLAGLGVKEKVVLGENDYDDLFAVFLDAEGRPTLQHLHYGAPVKKAQTTK